jgi:hypothetical protein
MIHRPFCLSNFTLFTSDDALLIPQRHIQKDRLLESWTMSNLKLGGGGTLVCELRPSL